MKWQCEICNCIYSKKEVEKLDWYDGPRCNNPEPNTNEYVCGGVVTGRSSTFQRIDFITKWFTITWWSFLFRGCTGFRNLICRVKGHPYDVVWFNNRMEPDMHCKNCGEDLG
jgi:hypothetical protein